MSAVIRAEGIWKRYNVRPAETLWRMLRRVNPWRSTGSTPNEFWALRDVSFEVQRGESLGIIGPNGAGKTTLLKILCGVTRATRGTAVVNGRTAPLIELSAGFHPELTGRENIYLNAAIMGMSKEEIRRKFDEIIAFSGLEEFIDTPVKKYSSGMFLRLGFSVAIHVEPDVLLVDEALAVGDAAFQMKCLAKMNEVRRQQRTIVFVSHHMHAVHGICDRVIYLNRGRLMADGAPADVIRAYTDDTFASSVDQPTRAASVPGQYSGQVRLTQIRFAFKDGEPSEIFRTGQEMRIYLHYHAFEPVEYPQFGVIVWNEFGQRITTISTYFDGSAPKRISGAGVAECLVPYLPLMPGRYGITAWIADRYGVESYHYLPNAGFFAVKSLCPDNMDQGIPKPEQGIVHVPSQWLCYDQVDAAGKGET